VPAASAAAGLGALLLLPAALGQGLLGIGAACAALAVARGGLASLAAVAAAAGLAFAGLHPLAAARDAALGPLAIDPVGAAAVSAERDLASPLELARLERSAANDAVARRALALHARRSGDLPGADARFRALLEEGGASFDLLNNAANARLASGAARTSSSTSRPCTSTRRLVSSICAAYGRASSRQDLALKQAQALDARAVHALTRLVAGSEAAARWTCRSRPMRCARGPLAVRGRRPAPGPARSLRALSAPRPSRSSPASQPRARSASRPAARCGGSAPATPSTRAWRVFSRAGSPTRRSGSHASPRCARQAKLERLGASPRWRCPARRRAAGRPGLSGSPPSCSPRAPSRCGRARGRRARSLAAGSAGALAFTQPPRRRARLQRHRGVSR
jgi:hypothetical protein